MPQEDWPPGGMENVDRRTRVVGEDQGGPASARQCTVRRNQENLPSHKRRKDAASYGTPHAKMLSGLPTPWMHFAHCLAWVSACSHFLLACWFKAPLLPAAKQSSRRPRKIPITSACDMPGESQKPCLLAEHRLEPDAARNQKTTESP